MNNKVLELAEQAGFGVENGSILAETISIDIEITAELEKFAELIIQEAMDIVFDEVSYISDWDSANATIARVKEHFEIE